jgi:hypothetical protein
MECDARTEIPDDPDDPFAPPRSRFIPERPSIQIDEVPLTALAVLRRTWLLFRERMWLCVGVVRGVIALAILIQILGALILTALATFLGDRPIFPFLYLVRNIAVLVVQIWLCAGLGLTLLKVARRQTAGFKDILTGGPFLLRVIVAGVPVLAIALAMIFLGCIIAGFIAVQFPFGMANPGLLPILVPIVVLAGLIVTLLFALVVRFGQFFTLVVDRNSGAIESLGLSWQLTRKRDWTLTRIFFLQVGIVLAGVVACLLGVLFALPLAILISVVTYLSLVGSTAANAKPSLETRELPGPAEKLVDSETEGAKEKPEFREVDRVRSSPGESNPGSHRLSGELHHGWQGKLS